MFNVLVVDDSAYMRMYIKDILKQLNCEVVAEASNGIQAIDLCQLTNLDLITLDITMPEMDGLTALREIRKINQSVHIVMISSMGQQAFIKDALTYGANDFIVKPFSKEKVAEIIKNQFTLAI